MKTWSYTNILWVALVAWLPAFSLYAQAPLLNTSGVNSPLATKWFEPSKLIETGVYYYPEAWPKAQWDRDLGNMVKMGFEFTHIGEFAWYFMEPNEGQYRFGWIDSVLQLAQKHKLKVIMCTPSAAPPIWISRTYPEDLMVNADGKRIDHQGRVHGSWSSAHYNELVRRVVAELGKRYGKHPAVWGWQIDNEPSHYGRYDYSENAQEGYRNWVKQKYGTLAKLNQDWGTSFWSNTYTSWDQIRCPNNQESTAGTNPHNLLDFKRFTADECSKFIRLQQQELRKHLSPEQWITTNYMSRHNTTDPWRNQDLDLVTYTMYLVRGASNLEKDNLSFRLGQADYIDFANDYFRSINGLTGVMELQPGQVNWGAYNPQPLPGSVRAWLWHSFSGGLKLACAYRYRQPLIGSELYHYGMVRTDGVTPTPGGLEYAKFIKEVGVLRKLADIKAKPPVAYEARHAAILLDPDNGWTQEGQRQTTAWPGYLNHAIRYFNILKGFTAPVDFTDTLRDWSRYPVLIAPSLQLISKETASKLERYVKQGGQLVLSCRSGLMDTRGQLWVGPNAAPILKLIGAREIPFFDHLPPDGKSLGSIRMGNKSYSWKTWADIIEPDLDTEVWATYDSEFYKGKAAVTHHQLGNGTVTYIGVHSEQGDLESDILERLYRMRGIGLQKLPPTLKLGWRDGVWVGVSYGTEPVEVPAGIKADFIVGKRLLKPADVAVWKE